MRKRKFFWGLIALAVVFVAVKAAWNSAYPSGSWRYKMTVTVETPEGLKTGSAIREIHAGRQPRIFPEAGGGWTVLAAGEAVVVDLGQRGVVFALLRGVARGADL